MPPADAPPTRRTLYTLLIVVAVGTAAAHIVSTQRVYEPSLHRPATPAPGDLRPAWPPTRPEPMPTFSSNDRSRWAAVRALVDNGTYVIGRRDKLAVPCSGPAALAATDAVSLAVYL